MRFWKTTTALTIACLLGLFLIGYAKCNNPISVLRAQSSKAVVSHTMSPVEFAISGDKKAANDAIPTLLGLRSLRSIRISGVELTSEQLIIIGNKPLIMGLSLVDCAISDNDLAHLADLKALKSLNLSRNPITGPGLRHLKGLQKLSLLNLNNTKIRGPGLEIIEEFPLLYDLRLNGTQIDDTGVEHLVQPHTRIRKLGLRHTNVTQLGSLKLAQIIWLREPPAIGPIVKQDGSEIDYSLEDREALRSQFRALQHQAISEAIGRGEVIPDYPHMRLPNPHREKDSGR